MLHYEAGRYGDEPYFWRDPADIREKLQSVLSNIERARREMESLQELREELIDAAGEGVYDESSEACRLLSDIESDIGDVEATIASMKEDLSDFKEELADTLYLLKGRGCA